MSTVRTAGTTRTSSLYLAFAALLVLLLLAVATPYLPFGRAALWISLAIAGLKMIVIAVFFMKLNQSTSAVRLAACAGLLWLSIAITCTMADYTTRGWRETPEHSLQQAAHLESYDQTEPVEAH